MAAVPSTDARPLHQPFTRLAASDGRCFAAPCSFAIALALPFAVATKEPVPDFANIPIEIGEASSTELPLTDSAELPPVTSPETLQQRRGDADQ